MQVWFYAVASVFLVSLVSLVGITTISISEEKLKKAVFILVSLAAGSLFGDAFIHLIPESFVHSGATLGTSFYILAGIFAFFVLEKFFWWKHEHVLESSNLVHPIGYLNLLGDGIHNLIDGMLIGTSYLVSLEVGIATTVAVFLHEIPQEIGDYALLLHAGFSKKKGLLLNFGSASLAIVGTIIALLVGASGEKYLTLILPITAGGFIYIAGSDLIPELHKERKLSKSIIQFVAMITGVGLMALLTIVE